MAYLLDTNVLLRESNTSDVQHSIVHKALVKLNQEGEILHIAPQILIEYRSVATRAVHLNGLGMIVAAVEAETERFKRIFPLLSDTAAIFPEWEAIVKMNAVVGKQVHDARLVAVCQTAGVQHLLTFNISDFKRYEPGLLIVSPWDVVNR